MKKENRNNKGFSLVELIVVIAIMAVLVGVLAPQFIKYVEKSRQSNDIQTADNVATAMKTYFTDKPDTETHTVKLTKASDPSVTGTNTTKALDEVKLEKARLKSAQWEITVTYNGSTGAITYTTRALSGGKVYYVANNADEFTPE